MTDVKRIAVAMSGGVDSSTVASLLVSQGHEVIGVGMRLPAYGEACDAGRRCCGVSGMDDARAVASRLGFRFYLLDFREIFERTVVADFCADYVAGRTPNPCVECNRVVKLGHLLEYVRSLGYDYLATGHYARIGQDAASGRFLLGKGADSEKDQTYFLYALDQDQLGHTLFPLGAMTKAETRQAARDAGLAVSEKPASQDICFLRDGDYRRFLAERFPAALQPGPLVDTRGTVLGTHRGIAFYTIGQRRGLGIATGRPVYVTAIDVDTRTVVIGDLADLQAERFSVTRLNWIAFAAPPPEFRCEVRTRHRQKTVPCTVRVGTAESAEVETDSPLPAVTPGQSAVFYDGDTVVGGGVIMRV